MINLNIETIILKINGVDVLLEYIEEKLSQNNNFFTLYKSTNLIFTNYYLIEYTVSLKNYTNINIIYNVDYNKYLLFLTPNSEVKFEEIVKEAYFANLILITKDTYKGKLNGQTNREFTFKDN